MKKKMNKQYLSTVKQAVTFGFINKIYLFVLRIFINSLFRFT